MLLQKTLHMSHPLAECKARLASIHSYRRQFLMVTKATVTSSKTVDFSFRGPLGFKAHTVLLAVDSESPEQYAFESVGGNIDLMGLVDFAEIRANWTEITLAVHYEIKNKLFASPSFWPSSWTLPCLIKRLASARDLVIENASR